MSSQQMPKTTDGWKRLLQIDAESELRKTVDELEKEFASVKTALERGTWGSCNRCLGVEAPSCDTQACSNSQSRRKRMRKSKLSRR